MPYYPRTHIANAYKYDIEARVDDVKENQTSNKHSKGGGSKHGLGFGMQGVNFSAEAEVHGSHSAGKSYQHQASAGYTPIQSGRYQYFEASSRDGIVYVSIKSRGRQIASDFPIKNDLSVIVDKDGYIQRTKYGQIWIDEEGRDHSRR